MSSVIRLAEERDLAAINDIYNHYVLNCTCTYQLDPDTLEDRRSWFRDHPPDKYPIVVAAAHGAVIGWGSLSKFRPRAGYAPTVEASIYIHQDHHRRGWGRKILADLIGRAREIGFHSIIGGASADRTASIALQKSLGFVQVAHFVEVGYKFGRRLDVVYLQKILSQNTTD